MTVLKIFAIIGAILFMFKSMGDETEGAVVCDLLGMITCTAIAVVINGVI